MEKIRKYMAEAYGTAVLVLVGCSAAMTAGQYEHISALGIALVFGLILIALIASLGHISGAHFNPAVSLAMLASGRMRVEETVKYIIAQFIGALIAGGILYLIASGQVGDNVANLGQNGYAGASAAGFSTFSAGLIEVIITFIFVRVILGVTSEKAYGSTASIAIGFTLTALILVAFPITGGSLNPARSLGPAFWVGGVALSQVWVFIVAPAIGGLLGGWTYRVMCGK